MIDIFFEMIAYIFIDLIFKGTLRGIKFVGLIFLKFMTLSKKPFGELREIYKDSITPYFLGFGAIIGIVYLIIKLIN